MMSGAEEVNGTEKVNGAHGMDCAAEVYVAQGSGVKVSGFGGGKVTDHGRWIDWKNDDLKERDEIVLYVRPQLSDGPPSPNVLVCSASGRRSGGRTVGPIGTLFDLGGGFVPSWGRSATEKRKIVVRVVFLHRITQTWIY